MTIRIFAAAAIVALAAGATVASSSAGTLQNGNWTPGGSCTDPGDVPHFNAKSPDAYNKSAKVAQDWQGKARDYADCVNKDAKADQQAVVSGANTAIGKVNDALNAMNEESKAAVDKLKKASGGSH